MKGQLYQGKPQGMGKAHDASTGLSGPSVDKNATRSGGPPKVRTGSGPRNA